MAGALYTSGRDLARAALRGRGRGGRLFQGLTQHTRRFIVEEPVALWRDTSGKVASRVPNFDLREARAQRMRSALVAHTDIREVDMFGGRSSMVDG
jgi:hypothetical protein